MVQKLKTTMSMITTSNLEILPSVLSTRAIASAGLGNSISELSILGPNTGTQGDTQGAEAPGNLGLRVKLHTAPLVL